MIKTKIVIIDNDTYYAKKLAAECIKNENFQLSGLFVSVSDMYKIKQINPHVIFVSDDLFAGESLEVLLDEISNLELATQTIGIINNPENASYFEDRGLACLCKDDYDIPTICSRLISNLESTYLIQTEKNVMADIDSELDKAIRLKKEDRKIIEEKHKEKMKSKVTLFKVNKKVISIYSPKGGAGKTMLAMELAHLLAYESMKLTPDINKKKITFTDDRIKICLVDFNASLDTMASTLESIKSAKERVNILSWLDAIDQKVNYNISTEDRKKIELGQLRWEDSFTVDSIQFDEQEVEKLCLMDKDTGLYIIPPIPLLQELSRTKPKYLDILINVLKQHFDLVILDTSNNVSIFSISAIKNSDMTLIVCPPNLPAVTTVGKFMKALQPLSLNKRNFKLVTNNSNYSKSNLRGEEISEVIDIPYIGHIVYEEKLFDSLESGICYAYRAPDKSQFKQGIMALGEEILPLKEALNVGKKKKHFFGHK